MTDLGMNPPFRGLGNPSTPAPVSGDHHANAVARHRWLRKIGPRNAGALYVLVVIVVVFSVWAPQTFLSWATVKQVVNGNAVTALAALALVVPLSARVFDLSFAYVISLSGVTMAHFVVNNGMPLLPAALLGIGAGLVIGFLNGVVVVWMRIDSLIGTLATASLVKAFITYFTDDTSVTGPELSGSFSRFSQGQLFGVTYSVYYAFAIAAVVWVVMEHTPAGRRVYAAGFGADAARLAGIRVDRLRFASLVVSSGVAAFAGIVLASTISAGSPTVGPPYLLRAFAAVFVGATQFKDGRFNAWGTIVAVVMLGTGIVGLGLAGAPAWAADMFTGVVLIAALSGTGLKQRSLATGESRGVFQRILDSLRRGSA